MGLFSKKTERQASVAATIERTSSNELGNAGNHELPSEGKVTFMAVWLGLVASIGGFMFGYVSGQISGK